MESDIALQIVTWSYVNAWELRIAYKSGYIAKTNKLYHKYYIFIVGKLESTDAHKEKNTLNVMPLSFQYFIILSNFSTNTFSYNF